MANMWCKTAKIQGLLSFISFFFFGSRGSSSFDMYFSLCLLFHSDDDPAKPQLNFQGKRLLLLIGIIIHHTHYEKSDWSRAFNQFTIACELDMINAISAADIAFILSSSTSAWLLSPLECSPQKQNG